MSHPEGNVDTLEKTLQQLQVVIMWSLSRECSNISESFLVLMCSLKHNPCFTCQKQNFLTRSWTPSLFGNWTTFNTSVPQFLYSYLIIFLIAPAGTLLKWPVFALLCADQQRASNPMGYTSDRGPSPGHCSARVGGLPGSSGGNSGPAELHTGQIEADGPKVSEPGPVAGGDGEGG